jgi:hypothetical protein
MEPLHLSRVVVVRMLFLSFLSDSVAELPVSLLCEGTALFLLTKAGPA